MMLVCISIYSIRMILSYSGKKVIITNIFPQWLEIFSKHPDFKGMLKSIKSAILNFIVCVYIRLSRLTVIGFILDKAVRLESFDKVYPHIYLNSLSPLRSNW